MKNGRFRTLFLLLGVTALAVAMLFLFGGQQTVVRSVVSYPENVTTDAVEAIPDAPVPLAAPRAAQPAVETIEITSTLSAVGGGTTEQVMPQVPAEDAPVAPAPEPPVAEEPAAPEGTEPEPPAEEPETPAEEPETPAEPPKAVKPSDIKDVKAMAKFLFDAATEFWAVEKDFCGTTKRPVSTRVAASIGAGTAVDCPGGDTVRVDDKGISHDSYAIADHFRAYVEMPDLKYFKIYLSEKDYTVDPYGAREEVTGTYYQYGSERATYAPEPEPKAETAEKEPSAEAAKAELPAEAAEG